jgi:DNA-binding MarR family transcriptional regulator
MSSGENPVQPLKIVSPVHKALRQISEHLIRQMDQIDAPGWESHLLSYVGVYGPCRVSELRTVFGYSPSTLTSVLDRLESEGLISRRPNQEDRRSVLITVTAKGRQIGRAARRAVEDFEAEILESLSDDDLDGFRRVMAAIAKVTQVGLRGKVEK